MILLHKRYFLVKKTVLPSQACFGYKNLAITLSYFLLITSLLCHSADHKDSVTFKSISIDEGLPHASVNQVLQDFEGYMWFATHGGLVKYDGSNFTVYEHWPQDTTSLSVNMVFCIYEDRLNNLWVGTHAGLSLFNRSDDTFINFKNKKEDSTSVSYGAVQSILQDSNGNLWIGTYGGGLNKLSSESLESLLTNRADPGKIRFEHSFNKYTTEHEENTALINFIYEDSFNFLWVCTGSGLYRTKNHLSQDNLASEGIDFNKFFPHITSTSKSEMVEVLMCYEDSHGIFWLGTTEGMIRVDFPPNRKMSADFVYYSHDPSDPGSISDNYVQSILEDVNGTFWVGTSEGLNSFDPQKEVFKHYSHDPSDVIKLSDGTINSIFIDRDNQLWFGTMDGGVNKLVYKKRFANYKYDPTQTNTLNGYIVYAFHESREGLLWIGTNHGLNILDKKTNLFVQSSQNALLSSDSRITAIYEDKSGVIWVGGDSQLHRLQPPPGLGVNRDRTRTLFESDPNDPNSILDLTIMSISSSKNDLLLLGSENGLSHFDVPSQHFYHHYEKATQTNIDEIVYSILHDSHANTWIGTSLGLKKINEIRLADHRIEYLGYSCNHTDRDCICKDIVYSIYESNDQLLWAGTQYGLMKVALDSAGKEPVAYTRYTKEAGLNGESVYCMLEDDAGNLWLNTNKGISKFNPDKETFRNFDKKDGLEKGAASGSNACFKCRDGQMAFGGLNGFSAFYPEEISVNTHQSPIVITAIKRNGSNINTNPALQNQHIAEFEVNDIITFEFTLLNYAPPEKNQYAYMLEGYDDSWIHSGSERSTHYSISNPGKYTFKVKASNSDGVWTEQYAKYPMVIKGPFWASWWFKSCIVLLVSLIIFIVFRYQLRINVSKRLKIEEVHSLPESLKNKFPEVVFTNREIEVLTELCKGSSYEMIANELFISKDTVRSHIKNVYKKMSVNSKSEAIAKVLSHRLVGN